MSQILVVDIGNSRMKWGRVIDGKIAEMVAIPLDNIDAWETTYRQSTSVADAPGSPQHWVVASVNPEISERFERWLKSKANNTITFVTHRQIPLQLAVESPEKVGVDRLLNAYAAHILVRPMPVIVFSLGTAITADLVDEHGAYHGGAIAPGARLMAKSLHDYTAKLPLIDNPKLLDVTCPGKNTDQAIRLGIAFSVVGMLHGLSSMLASLCKPLPAFVFTGGDLDLLTDARSNRWTLDPERSHYIPTLTLEGIRLASEAS